MWDSNVAGTMTGDNAASTAFTSVTSVSAYHIQRINSLQVLVDDFACVLSIVYY